jgi:hypothetical protein
VWLQYVEDNAQRPEHKLPVLPEALHDSARWMKKQTSEVIFKLKSKN